MKKLLFLTVPAIALAAVLSSCSKNSIIECAEMRASSEIVLTARNCDSEYKVVNVNGGATNSFYAYAPAAADGLKADITGQRQTLTVNVPSSTDGDQTDYLAAKAVASASPEVSLDFNHLLAQIFFTASTDCSALHVDIKRIGIENVSSEGTYDYGTDRWTASENTSASYYRSVGKTVSDSDVSLSGGNALLLIPQDGAESGARISVLCKIKDNDGFQIYPCSGEASTDDDGYAMAYIPVSPKWAAGGSYTYNLVFGDSASAVPVYDAAGESILGGSAITFNPSVSDWTSGSSTVSM